MPTHSERDEQRATWADTHKPGRLEAAQERGFDRGERDHPAPAHLTLGEWAPLLDAAVREAREVQGLCIECGAHPGPDVCGDCIQAWADEREHENWRNER